MGKMSFQTRMIASVLSLVLVITVGVIAVLAITEQGVSTTTQVSFSAEDIGAKIYVDFYHQNGATKTPLVPTGVTLQTSGTEKYFELDETSTGTGVTLNVPIVQLQPTSATSLNGETIYSSYVNYTFRIENTGDRDIHFVVDDTANANLDNLVCRYYYNIGTGRTLSRSNGFEILNTGYDALPAEELPGADTGTAVGSATFTMQCYVKNTAFDVDNSQVTIPITLQAITYNGSTNSMAVLNMNAEDDVNIASGQVNLYANANTTPYARYNLATGAAMAITETGNEEYIAQQVVAASALPRHIDLYSNIPVGTTSVTVEVTMVNATTNKGVMLNMGVIGSSTNGGVPINNNATTDSMVANKGSNATASLKTATFRKQYSITSGDEYKYVNMSLSLGIKTIEEVTDSYSFTYSLNTSGKSYAITGEVGVYEAIIPTYYNQLLVTNIGYGVFDKSPILTILTISNSVTSIEEFAFRNCSELTSLTIPDSVISIGNGAFQSCSGLTSVTIGTSVTSIGNSAFEGCSGLTSVTIGNSVTSIENYAFKNCIVLTNVTIGTSVSRIGNNAFEGCRALTNVTIPDSVSTIESYAFYFSGLTSLVIPNGVTSVGDNVCLDCRSLTSVTIGTSVTSIGRNAFDYCSVLTSITFEDTSTWHSTTDITIWTNKDGGDPINLQTPATNATYFKSTYQNYYWYKI